MFTYSIFGLFYQEINYLKKHLIYLILLKLVIVLGSAQSGNRSIHLIIRN